MTLKSIVRGLVGMCAAALLTSALAESAAAQAYVTFYQPAVTYYAPAPSPSPVYVAASPVVQPAPVVTYYRAPSVVYQPTTRVVSRYRPLLGGTVSRVRYGYAPVVYP